MLKKRKSKKKKNFIIAVVLIAVSSFVFAQVYLVFADKLKFDVLTDELVEETFKASSFIVKKETLIEKVDNGILSFCLEDGEKISKGGVIAETYSSQDDALIAKKLKDVEKKLLKLSFFEPEKKAVSTNLNFLEKQTTLALKLFLNKMNKAEYSNLSAAIEDVNFLLCQRQMILGEGQNLAIKLEELKKTKNDLEAKLAAKNVRKMLASEAGYFVSNVDGYEDLYDNNNVLKMKTDDAKNLIASTKKDSNSMAKIITSPNFYVCCVVLKKDLKGLEVGDEVKFNFHNVCYEENLGSITLIKNDDNKNESLIIIKSNFINQNTINLRREEITVKKKSYSGFKIPKDAVHSKEVEKKYTDDKGNEQLKKETLLGVYAKKGRKLVFKQAKIIFEAEDYLICEANLNNELTTDDNNQLKKYDEIVVKGKNLYEGRIV